MCIAGLGFIRSAPASNMTMNTATLMAMMAGVTSDRAAEHRHGLAEALVRSLVREELRRLLLRQQRPDGLGILARGEPRRSRSVRPSRVRIRSALLSAL